MVAWVIAGILGVAVIVQFVFMNSIKKPSTPPATLASTPAPPTGQNKGILAVIAILIAGALIFVGYQYWTEHTGEVVYKLGQVPFYAYAIGGATIVAVWSVLSTPPYQSSWARVQSAVMAFGVLGVALMLMHWLSGVMSGHPGNVSPELNNALTWQNKVAAAPPPAAPVVDNSPLPPPIVGVAQPNEWTAWYKMPLEQTKTVIGGNVRYQCGYGANVPARPEDIKDSPCGDTNWIRFQAVDDRAEDFKLIFHHKDDPTPPDNPPR